jgi:hypothetical protein
MSRITHAQLRTVQYLLAERWRHTQIARETSLSVWTVSQIDNSRRFQDQAIPDEDIPDDELPADDGPPDFEAGKMRRCTGCGGMVYQWPCLTCEHRELARSSAEHHRTLVRRAAGVPLLACPAVP